MSRVIVAAESPANPEARGLGVTALVFGIVALGLPVLALILGLLSAVSGDPALSMVTALLVVPLAGVLALLIGLIAVILALVLLARTGGRNRRWIPALVLGVLGAAFVPVLIVGLSLTGA